MADHRKIVLIAPNAGTRMGGEAIKAYQYFRWLLANGHDAVLITHGRNRAALAGLLPPERLRWVDETRLQALVWKIWLLRPLLGVYFYKKVARLLRGFDPKTTVVHYVSPISPVSVRFPPKGYRVVIGPLNGFITYPPAFGHREPRSQKTERYLYALVQRALGIVFGDKRKADALLNSGGERTRKALRWAGAADERMVDVLDSGVPMDLVALPAAEHVGRNPHFVALGRLDAYKAYDLTLRAVAAAEPDIRVTIHGDGPMRASLEVLAAKLGLENRAQFPGWLPHQRLPELRAYRGFVFPTLAEANGIVMQEAMMLGLPVLAVRWGGPATLADDGSAILIDPTSEQEIVARLAYGMNRLAGDPAMATRIGAAARRHAQANFGWDKVAQSWAALYPRMGGASPLDAGTRER